MRSKISKRILSETPQETKDKVNEYANKLVSSGVVSTCCEPVGEGFYLGASCPKCKRPFRQVNK